MRVLRNKLPAIEKTGERKIRDTNYHSNHTRSYLMSERKHKLRFDSVEVTERPTLHMKNSLSHGTCLSATRSKVMDYTKAANILFKRTQKRIEQASEGRKTNSLSGFYKDLNKPQHFRSHFGCTNSPVNSNRRLVNVRKLPNSQSFLLQNNPHLAEQLRNLRPIDASFTDKNPQPSGSRGVRNRIYSLHKKQRKISTTGAPSAQGHLSPVKGKF